jgi:threonine/homoserine/homoserine lactone efflux protein
MSLEFLLTSTVVVLLPGTGVIYMIAIGLGRGWRASIFAAIGCTIGILPAALAGVLGLSAVLHTSAIAFQVIKYLGVAYLFFMAWNMLRDGSSLSVTADQKPVSMFRTALNGTMLNILNPKLSFFFMAFLPQFLTHGTESYTREMLILAAVFMALTMIIFVAYGICASLARHYVISRPRVMLWFRRTFAATFTFLGMRLALSD